MSQQERTVFEEGVENNLEHSKAHDGSSVQLLGRHWGGGRERGEREKRVRNNKTNNNCTGGERVK